MKNTNNEIFCSKSGIDERRICGKSGAVLLALVLSSAIVFSVRGAPDTRNKHVDKSSSTDAVVKVAFNTDCEGMLIQEINRADKEIVIAIYNITRKKITSALVRAARRGVKVRAKFDDSSHHESKGMSDAVKYLQESGVVCTPVKMSEKDGRMHDKFSVIDGKRVLTGSFNYTSSASTLNYENLVLIESESVAGKYLAEFENIKSK